MSRVRVTIYRSAADGMREGFRRGALRAAMRVQHRAQTIIRDKGRIDVGDLRRSIEVTESVFDDNRAIFRVGSRLPYALAQHNGVKGPIRPRRAKVLRFKPKGSKTFVFARQVKGFTGIYYLTNALKVTKPSEFRPDTSL